MTRIRLDNRKKRGCEYCADVIPSRKVGNTIKPRQCPYDQCPYHELDKAESYDQYMRTADRMGIARALEALG